MRRSRWQIRSVESCPVKELASAVDWIRDPDVPLREEHRRLHHHHMLKVTATQRIPANNGKSTVSRSRSMKASCRKVSTKPRAIARGPLGSVPVISRLAGTHVRFATTKHRLATSLGTRRRCLRPCRCDELSDRFSDHFGRISLYEMTALQGERLPRIAGELEELALQMIPGGLKCGPGVHRQERTVDGCTSGNDAYR